MGFKTTKIGIRCNGCFPINWLINIWLFWNAFVIVVIFSFGRHWWRQYYIQNSIFFHQSIYKSRNLLQREARDLFNRKRYDSNERKIKISLPRHSQLRCERSARSSLPFPLSRSSGHDRFVSSRISKTSRCCSPARSARAIPSATPATATPIINCRTRFILEAQPTSPVNDQLRD